MYETAALMSILQTRCPKQLCDKIVTEVERVNKEPEKITQIAEDHVSDWCCG